MALSRFRQVKSADEEANLLERAVPKSTRYKEPVGINMLNNILPSLCKECKLSPVRSIGDNDFLRVISWACWYYHPLLVLVNYLLCYVAIYSC